MSEATEVKTISRDELKQKIDRGDNFILVETLAPMAYDGGHLPRAINLPPDQVSKRAYEVLPDRTADIVVYCGSPT
jgi:rhodanese-related sulfurtransferase